MFTILALTAVLAQAPAPKPAVPPAPPTRAAGGWLTGLTSLTELQKELDAARAQNALDNSLMSAGFFAAVVAACVVGVSMTSRDKEIARLKKMLADRGYPV